MKKLILYPFVTFIILSNNFFNVFVHIQQFFHRNGSCYTDDFVYRTYHADFYHYRHSNLIDIVDMKAILKF